MMPAASKLSRSAAPELETELEQVQVPEQVLEPVPGLGQVQVPEQEPVPEPVLGRHIQPPTDRPALYRQQPMKLLFSSFIPPLIEWSFNFSPAW
jgi:hypothetical protein